MIESILAGVLVFMGVMALGALIILYLDGHFEKKGKRK